MMFEHVRPVPVVDRQKTDCPVVFKCLRCLRGWSFRAGLAVMVFLLGAPPNRSVGSGSDDIDHLRATQEVFRDVVSRVRPYLVRIDTVGGTRPRSTLPTLEDDGEGLHEREMERAFRDTTGSNFVVADGSTTGLIYSSDGYIITSSFNFVRDPALVSVTLADGRRLVADLIARDKVRKIALLKIDVDGLPVPTWLYREDVRVGQWAIALGLGYGGDRPSATVGIVSALNRMNGNAVQTDAKLSPVNYGGPLCDSSGRIIGLCVPMAQRPGELAGIEMYDSGIGFALSKDRVSEIASSLMEGRSFYRGWLGMSASRKSTDGVLIVNVADPSPLTAVGVRPGDKILWAEGRPVRNFSQLVQAIYLIPAGEEIYLHLVRDGIEFGVCATLARNTELGHLPKVPQGADPQEFFPKESDNAEKKDPDPRDFFRRDSHRK